MIFLPCKVDLTTADIGEVFPFRILLENLGIALSLQIFRWVKNEFE